MTYIMTLTGKMRRQCERRLSNAVFHAIAAGEVPVTRCRPAYSARVNGADAGSPLPVYPNRDAIDWYLVGANLQGRRDLDRRPTPLRWASNFEVSE